MIHQPIIGLLQGNAIDKEIMARQTTKTKSIAVEILSENCNQPVEQVLKYIDRDYWMNANESIEYGIVDKIYEMK